MKPCATARRGFTMAEMIIAMVILAVIGASLTRILGMQAHSLPESGFATRQTRVSRGARNAIDSDLRMVEASNGLVSASCTTAHRALAVRDGDGLRPERWRDHGQRRPGGFGGLGDRRSLRLCVARCQWRVQLCRGRRIHYDFGPARSAPRRASRRSPAGRVVALAPALPAGAVAGTAVLFEQRLLYEFKTSVMVPGSTGLWRTVVSDRRR